MDFLSYDGKLYQIKTTLGDCYDLETIGAIVDRVLALPWSPTQCPDRDEVTADLLMAHASCPFDLNGLLHANDADFCHDVLGIRRFLDRATGELVVGHTFNPKFAGRSR